MARRIKLTESDLHRIVKEVINEAFKSNSLRDWFKQHGGVKRGVSQEGLGDANEYDIVYMREYKTKIEAKNECWKLNHPKSKWSSGNDPFDQNTIYRVYEANDGCCVVVGIRRGSSSDIEYNRGYKGYVDDSNRYYYSPHGQYFGLFTNKNYKDKLSDIEDKKELMSKDDFNAWRKNRARHLRNYRDIKGEIEKEHEKFFGTRKSAWPDIVGFKTHMRDKTLGV